MSVIPTYESVQMQEWYQQTVDRQKELGITVLGSNSTVAMQDETFPACKIEFWRVKESELESEFMHENDEVILQLNLLIEARTAWS